MGGVLPYKWAAYFWVCLSAGLEARKVQRYKWGAHCCTNWRCNAVLSSGLVGVGVSETLLIFEHPQGSGTSRQNSGTSQIRFFETQGRQTFEGGHKLFGHHPFAWKTPTPPGRHQTQEVNLCALLSCDSTTGPASPCLQQRLDKQPSFGSHLRTPALKTKSLVKKSVVLVKRKNGFTKTLFSLFFQGFLSRGWF